MLVGQEIGVIDALVISVSGIAVVMLALAILAGFVYFMGYVMLQVNKKAEEKSS